MMHSSAEIVRAMTYVINQGMAMYWGTSRWTAMEIMVSCPKLLLPAAFADGITEMMSTENGC